MAQARLGLRPSRPAAQGHFVEMAVCRLEWMGFPIFFVFFRVIGGIFETPVFGTDCSASP
jgi:hypothetical protein